MAARNLLHKSKLEDFKEWCEGREIRTRPPLGQFQVLQVYVIRHGWMAIYEKINAKEHYSVDKRMVKLVKQFIIETTEGL